MPITYHLDLDGVDDELNRLEGIPSHRDIAALDGVLLGVFDLTQVAVHIETGSLRGSGSPATDYDRVGKRWTGSIEYGGPSPGGVHDPVRYAFYEWRRRGSHDFMRPVDLAEPAFELAVLFVIAGRT